CRRQFWPLESPRSSRCNALETKLIRELSRAYKMRSAHPRRSRWQWSQRRPHHISVLTSAIARPTIVIVERDNRLERPQQSLRRWGIWSSVLKVRLSPSERERHGREGSDD